MKLRLFMAFFAFTMLFAMPVGYASNDTSKAPTVESLTDHPPSQFVSEATADNIALSTPQTTDSLWTKIMLGIGGLMAVLEVIIRLIPAAANFTPLTILYKLFDLLVKNNAGSNKALRLEEKRE